MIIEGKTNDLDHVRLLRASIMKREQPWPKKESLKIAE